MWGPYNVAVMRHDSIELAVHMRAVGDLIRRRRRAKGMNQERLGAMIDLSRKTMGLVEQGKRPLNQIEMDILARALGLTRRAFYEPPPPSQLVSEPLDGYLTDVASEVVEEGVEMDRRRRDRRTPGTPPSSQP
jgi:transcriptional regulator with XRE-family HTH domain